MLFKTTEQDLIQGQYDYINITKTLFSLFCFRLFLIVHQSEIQDLSKPLGIIPSNLIY